MVFDKKEKEKKREVTCCVCVCVCVCDVRSVAYVRACPIRLICVCMYARN